MDQALQKKLDSRKAAPSSDVASSSHVKTEKIKESVESDDWMPFKWEMN